MTRKMTGRCFCQTIFLTCDERSHDTPHVVKMAQASPCDQGHSWYVDRLSKIVAVERLKRFRYFERTASEAACDLLMRLRDVDTFQGCKNTGLLCNGAGRNRSDAG